MAAEKVLNVAYTVDGAQYTFNQSLKFDQLNSPRWGRGKGRHAANSHRGRSSETYVISESHRYSECRSTIVAGNQLRQDLHRWLSPPDPSTNHNIACRAHHKRTATWFIQGRIFNKWKSTSSFLWIHGKREPPSRFLPDIT